MPNFALEYQRKSVWVTRRRTVMYWGVACGMEKFVLPAGHIQVSVPTACGQLGIQ